MLKGKDLQRNSIVISNSILSARLICILDFIFAETTPIERAAWIAACETHNRSWFSNSSSRSITARVVANLRRHAPGKSKIAGVR
jgi:hypothetical protein